MGAPQPGDAHAATGPRAIALILPHLPEPAWTGAYDTAWLIAAAVTGAYRADPAQAVPRSAREPLTSTDEASELARASGDEHAIKFTEVAVESHRRGSPHALPAARLACSLL